MNPHEIKTVLRFEDPTLERVFGKMESTRDNRADVRRIYRLARMDKVNRPEARLIALGASLAYGFWTGKEMT